MTSKTAIITQVRTTSTRLPRKVLKKVNTKTILEYHIERLQWSELPIIVATTTNREDDIIVEICNKYCIDLFRGDELNVLSRYYLAAKQYNISTVIRVTSDCPLIDGKLIASALTCFNNCDYLSNTITRTYPKGLDFEIFSFWVLEDAFKNAKSSFEKEHVTPYICNNVNNTFRLKSYLNTSNESHFRITLDTTDDFILIKELIEKFKCDNLNYQRILEILRNNYE